MSNSKICSICHEKVKCNDVKLPCNHVYHHDCIEKWKEVNPICPLCHFQIDSPIAIKMTDLEFRTIFKMLILVCYFLRFYEVFMGTYYIDLLD